MQLEDLCRFSFRTILSYRLRTVLMLCAMAIGVASVVLLVSLGESARNYVLDQFSSMGTNLLIIRPGMERRGPVRQANVQTLTPKDAEAIAKLPNVKAVAPEAGNNAQVKYMSQNVNTTILGTTAAFLEVNNFTIEDGRFLEEEDEAGARKVAVLGATPASALFGRSRVVGETIKIKGVNFESDKAILEPSGDQVPVMLSPLRWEMGNSAVLERSRLYRSGFFFL